MTGIYRIANIKRPDISQLIMVGHDKITGLVIDRQYESTGVNFHLKAPLKLCDVIPNVHPKTYFFKKAGIYSAYKSPSLKLLPVSQVPGEFNPRVFRPIIQHESYPI